MLRKQSEEGSPNAGRRRVAWVWGLMAAVLGLVATTVALVTWDAVVRERMRIVTNQQDVLKTARKESGGIDV